MAAARAKNPRKIPAIHSNQISRHREILDFRLTHRESPSTDEETANGHIPVNCGSYLARQLKNIATHWKTNERFSRQAASGALAEHFYIIWKQLSCTTCAIPEKEPLRIRQIHDALEHHLTNPLLSVQWLAREMHCNADYISRLYRRETGETLIALIARKRLTLACHHLKSSQMNIAEVSRAVGYDAPNYFASLFRKIYGVSPRRYRQLLLDDRVAHA